MFYFSDLKGRNIWLRKIGQCGPVQPKYFLVFKVINLMKGLRQQPPCGQLHN